MLYKKENINSATEIILAAHKLWSIQGDQHDVISCTKGSLWITQEADLKDYVIEEGMDFWVTTSGHIVVEALNDAQFQYSLHKRDDHIKGTKLVASIQRIQA